MNQLESRLTRELDADAQRVDVDVDALWQRVAARTIGGANAPMSKAGRRRRRFVPLLAGVAAAAVIAAVAIPLANRGGSDPDASTVSPTDGPVEGPVGDWACAHQAELESRGPSVVAAAETQAEPTKAPSEAAEYGVPRYQYEIDGATGVLKYGDADGNLIAVTALRRDGDNWVAGTRRVCSGSDDLPSPDPVRLGEYTDGPLSFPDDSAQVQEVPSTGSPVVVDDRTYYDEVGLLRHTTLYAYPTARGVQLVGSPPNNNSFVMGSYRNETFGINLIDGVSTYGAYTPAYDFRGLDQGEVYAYFSIGDSDVVGLSTALRSVGTQGTEKTFDLAGGTLYTVKAAVSHDGDQLVTLTHADGTEETIRY